MRIYNKKLKAWTTLYIANKSVTHEQAIAAGCDPRAARSYDGASVDAIVEVDMQGKVVWEWWFFDHVVQDVDPAKPNYTGGGKTVADHPGRINLNIPGRPLRRNWLHCNSLDYNAQTGQVVTNSVQGEFYVIDHDGTFVAGDPEASIAKAASSSGNFLYRFGDPARYGQGDPPAISKDWTRATPGHKQIGGSHDIHWIRPGLPGAGHFLIFNNGQYLFQRTNQSYVMEINPHLDGGEQDTGRYVDPPRARYRQVRSHHDTHKPTWQVSNQVVWIYSSKSNQGFFSHIGSGAQRLPNGNTQICSMTEGHLFEVTPEGEVVWEYINPMTREGAVTTLKDGLPMSNAVFRALRYGGDHPALKDKDVTPKGTIAERWAKGLDRPARVAQGGKGDGRPGGPRRRDNQGERRDDRQPSPPDEGDMRVQDRPPEQAGGGGRNSDDRSRRDHPGGGGQRQPGGMQDRERRPGRPVVLVKLDANADGRLSTGEIANAPVVLKALDANGDGKLSREEWGRRIEESGRDRSSGDRRGGSGNSEGRRPLSGDRDLPNPRLPRQGQPSSRGEGVTAPDAALSGPVRSAPRPPWPLVHAKELDANGDGSVTAQEMLAQTTKTFTACDQNSDGKLTDDEYGSRDMPRTPMAGFVKGHAKELDVDRDGAISKTELLDAATRMFRGSDANRDGKLTADEYTEAVEFGKANPKQGPGQRSRPTDEQGRRSGGEPRSPRP